MRIKLRDILLLVIAIALCVIAVRVHADVPQVADQRTVDLYWSHFPKTSNKALDAALANHSDWVIFTETEVPRVYQHNSGFYWAYKNIGPPAHPTGNAAAAKPWFPDNPKNVRAIFAIRLPVVEGKMQPAVYSTIRLPEISYRPDLGLTGPSGSMSEDTFQAIWFPAGTLVVELKLMQQGDTAVAYQMFVRERLIDRWDFGIYRPFATAEQLNLKVDQAIEQVQFDDRANHNHTGAHSNGVLRGGVVPAPEYSAKQLIELLHDREWQNCVGEVWARGRNGVDAFAPVGQTPFSLMPAGEKSHLFGNGSLCMNCHASCLSMVGRYQFGVDWYGAVPGTIDGIIFAGNVFVNPRVVNYVDAAPYGRGGDNWIRPAVRPLLERYSPERHPANLYNPVVKGMDRI